MDRYVSLTFWYAQPVKTDERWIKSMFSISSKKHAFSKPVKTYDLTVFHNIKNVNDYFVSVSTDSSYGCVVFSKTFS